MGNSLLERITPFAGPLVLMSLAVGLLSVFGVPVLLAFVIIGIGWAYTKGYRATLTINKKG